MLLETDYELIAQYPSVGRKRLMHWNDARLEVVAAGEAWTAEGKPKGSPSYARLLAAEEAEITAHQSCFGI